MPILVCCTMVTLFSGLLEFWQSLSVAICYFFDSVVLFIAFLLSFFFTFVCFQFPLGKMYNARLSTKVAARIVNNYSIRACWI